MSLGQNIRNIRKNKGYSIMKVKEMTGLSKSTISEIENDKSSPTSETLQKIASALECQVSVFFDEDRTEAIEETKIDEYMDKNKLFFSKFEKLNDKNKDKVLKIMEMFEDETND